MRVSSSGGTVIARSILLALLLMLWEWAAKSGAVSPVLLPPITEVIPRLVQLGAEPAIWSHLGWTVVEIVGGFLIAVVLGILMGFLSGRSATRATVIEPIFNWCQTVPIVLLYPILIGALGLGSASRVAFAALYAVFPIAYGTSRAFMSVDGKYVRNAVACGAGETSVLIHVLIPAAFPRVVASLRIGAALALVAVVAGQIVASSQGLGYLISDSSRSFEIPDMYVYIVVAILFVSLFNVLLTLVARRGWTEVDTLV